MVHAFHRYLKVAPVRPMAAREYPPHFRPTTTPKTAIREATQTPAILWALRSSLPSTNNPRLSPGGTNPNAGVERRRKSDAPIG